MYKNKKIRIYSIIIFSLLVVDFFINSYEQDLPRDVLEPEDYRLLTSIKDVIHKKDIDHDIIRLSRKRNEHIHILVRSFLDRLCVFDQNMSDKMYKNYENNFLQNRVIINDQKINANRLYTILQNFEEQPSNVILEKAQNLQVYRYCVYFLDDKRTNYVINTSAIGKKHVLWCKQIYIKHTEQDKSGYTEYAQIHNVYSCLGLWQKIESLSLEKLCVSNYSACKDLILGIKSNVGLMLDDKYYYIGYANIESEEMRKLDFRVNREDMRLEGASCYLCNDVINNYTFQFDSNDLLYVGFIDHVGKMLDYNVFAGVVNHQLDNGLLECIMRSTVRDIWNYRTKFIVSTLRGMYYIVREPCVDIGTLRKVLAINRASVVALNGSGVSKVIMTPLRHPETFVDTMFRCYGISFPNVITSASCVNYHDLLKVNLSIQKTNVRFHCLYSSYRVLDLLENEYSFI